MFAQKTVPTLKCASALSKIRQRQERRKKDQQVISPAATMYCHRAVAMVVQTRPHSTPRKEKYSRTTASRLGRTHDQTLRRPAFSALPTRPGAGCRSGLCLHIHEVVTDHVHHDHVSVLDAAHVRVGNLDA